MFGIVGKLVSRAIFSACHFFKLGPQKNPRQPTKIVPKGTKLAGAAQKELICSSHN